MDQYGVVVGQGVMNTPVTWIHRRLINEDAPHCRTGEVVCRLHSFIVIFAKFQCWRVVGGGGTLRKLVSENISIIIVGISINY